MFDKVEATSMQIPSDILHFVRQMQNAEVHNT